MTTYTFDHWEDETGTIVGAEPALTVTVTSYKTFRAVYIPIRNVTYQSTPVAVVADINGTPVNSGETVQVNDGTIITLTVPQTVEK